MKKIFTLFSALLLTVSALHAETVLVDYDFNDGDKSGLGVYDVDNLTPSDFMQQIGFSVGNTWILIKDTNTSTDMFVGSTSQYKPAGQANDWLVLPATLIPGHGFSLEWKSQAFYANKRDGLKVFISTQGGKPEDFPATPVWEVAEEVFSLCEQCAVSFGVFIHIFAVLLAIVHIVTKEVTGSAATACECHFR